MTAILQLEQFLPYRLSTVSNAVSEAIAQVYRDQHGLSMTEWRVLAVLAVHPQQSAQRLVQLTRLDKVSISRALKRLLSANLVQRRTDQLDRRRMPLALSQSGIKLYAQIAPAVAAREHELLGALDPVVRAQLHQVLDRLEALLSEFSTQQVAAAALRGAPQLESTSAPLLAFPPA